ncbi:MarR family winged helix-turn-helix transcriptional regulator [Chloroflexota bacterium]
MQVDILKTVATDLMSIPPLVARGIRRKLIRTTLAEIDMNITPLHFEIMRLLEAEGALHAAQIGDRLQLARAQITQLIDKLAEYNLVSREVDAADRRIVNISMTDHGKTVLAEHKASIANAIRESMTGLSEDDLQTLSTSLRKVQEVLQKLD